MPERLHRMIGRAARHGASGVMSDGAPATITAAGRAAHPRLRGSVAAPAGAPAP